MAFICECNGCRNFPKDFKGRQYWKNVAKDEVNGFYFSDSTMKFFSCRITDFFPLKNGGAVFYTTQRAGFDNYDRERRWVVVCPFGEIVADSKLGRYSVDSKSAKKFERARNLGVFDRIAGFCACHGCQIQGGF